MRMSISDRASQARRPQREARPKPQFIARAKVGNGWITIGACWPLKSGEEGFSLKLTSTPLNWDGRFVLLPPIADDAAAHMAEE
jgi:hypothetical protein